MIVDHHVKLIAFYLPQFHPIPENDGWWGTGFTEWNNVVKASPLFPGHYQPHLPADLGFYDLRVPETRHMQAELANAYGISGFCYYHYWFHGKRLLERPFQDVLTSGQPDFPFCLCWANEPWTRRWDGIEHEVLIRQTYSIEDDRQHIRWLCKVFQDQRYIRIQGKPLFLVYRATQLPNALYTTTVWREEAQKAGIGDIFLCRMESFPDEHDDPKKLGFDAAVEFDREYMGKRLQQEKIWQVLRTLGIASNAYAENYVYDYQIMVENRLRKPRVPYLRFPCVFPGWDNTPRRKVSAGILVNSTPNAYEKWLRGSIEQFLPDQPDKQILFINAWNEWGEGAHLEPCQKWGRAYLEATQRGIRARDITSSR